MLEHIWKHILRVLIDNFFVETAHKLCNMYEKTVKKLVEQRVKCSVEMDTPVHISVVIIAAMSAKSDLPDQDKFILTPQI